MIRIFGDNFNTCSRKTVETHTKGGYQYQRRDQNDEPVVGDKRQLRLILQQSHIDGEKGEQSAQPFH